MSLESESKRPRMKDIAKLAGVSTITVSRALRTPDVVSKSTLDRINAAVEATGFIADLHAGSLRSGTNKLIATVVPTLQTSIAGDTIEGLSSVLKPRGYQIMIAEAHYDLQKEEGIVRDALRWRPAAIILSGVTHSPATLDMIRRADIPLAEVWGETDQPRDIVVAVPNRSAAYRMTQSLIAWGYRRIGFVHFPVLNNERMLQRIEGFHRAMREAGLEVTPEMTMAASNAYSSGAQAVIQLKERVPGLDAVFCASDVLAVGALTECQRRGWRVPHDLAVAGFDDFDIGSIMVPPLTTIRTNRFDSGRRAAELILGRIEGNKRAAISETMGFEIVRRGSA